MQFAELCLPSPEEYRNFTIAQQISSHKEMVVACGEKKFIRSFAGLSELEEKKGEESGKMFKGRWWESKGKLSSPVSKAKGDNESQDALEALENGLGGVESGEAALNKDQGGACLNKKSINLVSCESLIPLALHRRQKSENNAMIPNQGLECYSLTTGVCSNGQIQLGNSRENSKMPKVSALKGDPLKLQTSNHSESKEPSIGIMAQRLPRSFDSRSHLEEINSQNSSSLLSKEKSILKSRKISPFKNSDASIPSSAQLKKNVSFSKHTFVVRYSYNNIEISDKKKRKSQKGKKY